MPRSRRPASIPSIPANAAKLDVVEQLVELADEHRLHAARARLAFTVAHPAVTSVIIGPRTMEQLDGLLKGAALTLDDATLDRIDEIVPPGTNLYHPDGAWRPPVADRPGPPPPPTADRAAA